ncbi:Ig-like domain-containing protein [Methanobrevibacter sp.]|uniref:Ig-like domain-containing protein n=1 Tax=Methanobrevibacter sp. TaxID=66852 RepID=UPI0025DD778F|nr:Ig-like domain-containing protein [Methanobrevibacter sp.]MBR4448307.1 Ig-like domain-containing protein [Methanobrevibacter sp.]
MKKTIIFVVLLFILVGAVSASENLTNDDNETLSVEQTPTENLTLSEDAEVLQNETPQETHDNPTPAPGKPTITTYAVSGTQGKYITLKAVVKNSSGPVKGMKVTFKLNGETYTAVTDANGVATKTVKCPKTALSKTTTKKTSKKLTKTKYYSKTYTASASVDSGESSTFKVISKKPKLVKKYKIVHKKKTMTVPLKKGSKTFKKGKYSLYTYRGSESGVYVFGALMAKKDTSGTIKFSIKMHFKESGKWIWTKWYKVSKNSEYTTWYPKNIKVNKVKVQYTQESYKRIK